MQKLTIVLLCLLLGIAGDLRAQKETAPAGEDRVFGAPPFSFGIEYRIKLGKGNILRIDLANGYDMRSFRNIDSLLTRFLADMTPFRDSLADPLTVKHIDYVIDPDGKKKLRIRQYRPAASSFLLDGPEPAILRVQQDSIRILVVTRTADRQAGRTVKGLRYDRLCFFVNYYSDLAVINNQRLNDEIASIISRQLVKHNVYRHPYCYLVDDSIVHSRVTDRGLDRLEISAGGAASTYKNMFSPSFSVGAYANLNRGPSQYRLGLSWEPLFFFHSDSRGRLQTFRNDMVVVTYSHTHTGKPAKPAFTLDPAFSLGYVFYREGDYFARPSFRLTIGAGKLGGAVRIEPALFFDNFFRSVTPGLRLSFGAF
jgi:hypothetical protein